MSDPIAGLSVDDGQTASSAGSFSSGAVPVTPSAPVGGVTDKGGGAWSWSLNTAEGHEAFAGNGTDPGSDDAPSHARHDACIDTIGPTTRDDATPLCYLAIAPPCFAYGCTMRSRNTDLVTRTELPIPDGLPVLARREREVALRLLVASSLVGASEVDEGDPPTDG